MNTEIETLAAADRSETGTGAARRLRATGQIPAIVYGKSDPVSVSISRHDFLPMTRTEYGFNKVFTLDVKGGNRLCMVKDYQIDSVRREITHVDFYEVDPEQFVTIKVPVTTTGTSVGVKAGGRLVVVAREIKVRCKVKDIPAAVPHDVTALQVSEAVYVDEMSAPQDCELVFKNRFPVIRVAKKRAGKKGADAEETAAAAAPAEA